jgi:hypothetical protein
MVSSRDRDRPLDFKLDGDLRDAYVELLSAQCAVDRIKLRYSPEDIATKGSAFMVSRSISAANMICEYFSRVQQSFPLQAGPRRKSREDETGNKSL